MSNEGSLCCCELYHHLPIGTVNTNLSQHHKLCLEDINHFHITQLVQILCVLHNISPFSFFFSLFPTSSKNI